MKRNGESYELTLRRDATPLAGGGGMAAVYVLDGHGVNASTSQVACKMATTDAEAIERIKRERFYFDRMRNEGSFPVPYLGAWTAGDPHVLTEYDPTFVLARAYLAAPADHPGLYRGQDDLQGLCIALLEAVGDLHAIGILHCDLKPANLLLRQDVSGRFRIRLIDLGHAHSLDGWASPDAATGINKVGGTPGWTSPSRISGQTSEVADIWGLGLLAMAFVLGDADPLNTAATPTVVRQQIERKLSVLADILGADDSSYRFIAAALRESVADHREAIALLEQTVPMASAAKAADVTSAANVSRASPTTPVAPMKTPAAGSLTAASGTSAGSAGSPPSPPSIHATPTSSGGARPWFAERYFAGEDKFRRAYRDAQSAANQSKAPPFDWIRMRPYLLGAVAIMAFLFLFGAVAGWW